MGEIRNKVWIEIDVGNDAFRKCYRTEVVRILKELLEDLDGPAQWSTDFGKFDKTLMAINGNSVGKYREMAVYEMSGETVPLLVSPDVSKSLRGVLPELDRIQKVQGGIEKMRYEGRPPGFDLVEPVPKEEVAEEFASDTPSIEHEDCERQAPWDKERQVYICGCGKQSTDGVEWRYRRGTTTDNMATSAFDRKHGGKKRVFGATKGKKDE